MLLGLGTRLLSRFKPAIFGLHFVSHFDSPYVTLCVSRPGRARNTNLSYFNVTTHMNSLFSASRRFPRSVAALGSRLVGYDYQGVHIRHLFRVIALVFVFSPLIVLLGLAINTARLSRLTHAIFVSHSLLLRFRELCFTRARTCQDAVGQIGPREFREGEE